MDDYGHEQMGESQQQYYDQNGQEGKLRKDY